MAAINLIGEGQAFLGENPQVVKVKKVTVGFDTGDVNIVAQEASAIVNVPANTLVLDVLAVVNTAFTATTTLDVGDGTDPNGWLASAKIDPQTVDGSVKRSTAATAEALAVGKLYTAADTIDITVGVADVDAGELDVFILFIENVSPL